MQVMDHMNLVGIIIFPDEYLIDAKNEWGGDIKVIPDEYLNLDVINVEIE